MGMVRQRDLLPGLGGLRDLRCSLHSDCDPEHRLDHEFVPRLSHLGKRTGKGGIGIGLDRGSAHLRRVFSALEEVAVWLANLR